MPPEQVHDGGPREAGEDGPGVVPHLVAGSRAREDGQAGCVAGLHGQLGQGQHHARKHVDDDLLADARDLAGARRALAEDEVASEEAGEEAVVGTWGEEGGMLVELGFDLGGWLWKGGSWWLGVVVVVEACLPCPSWGQSASGSGRWFCISRRTWRGYGRVFLLRGRWRGPFRGVCR